MMDIDFEEFLRNERQKDLKKALSIMNDMMGSFRDWFPFDESYNESEQQDAEDAFARTKLLLELGAFL